jgi:cytochrome b
MGSKIYRGVLIVNVTAMLLQSLFAGKLLGGDAGSLLLHERTGKFLVLLAVAQLMLAVYLRMRSNFPRWIPIASAGLLLAEVIEFAAGDLHKLVIHVPLGVAIFGGMLRQLLWSAGPSAHSAPLDVPK